MTRHVNAPSPPHFTNRPHLPGAHHIFYPTLNHSPPHHPLHVLLPLISAVHVLLPSIPPSGPSSPHLSLDPLPTLSSDGSHSPSLYLHSSPNPSLNFAVSCCDSSFFPSHANIMKKLKRHPPSPTAELRRLDPDSKALCPDTLVNLKNARLRRLKIQRVKLKYTCEAKIHVSPGDRGEGTRSADSKGKDGRIHESMRISLSLTTSSSKEDDRSSLAGNNGVLVDGSRGEKFREDCCDVENLSYGSVSLIGRRKEMEDAVSIEVGFVMKERTKYDFFAVYDGHGGAQVAKACRERLYQLVAEELERHGRNGGEVDWERMMEGCFGKMDSELAENAAIRTVGSTAVVAVVEKDEVVVANCGDSRAVMGRGGEAFALSDDHKPNRPDELLRIEAAGGRVINWNGQRVLGVLATSRSIGDQYLRPFVISKPEVTVTKRTKEDEFLILASDGLWDVISSEAACEVVRKCLRGQARRRNSSPLPELESQSLASEAAALLAELAMVKGSRDNTSVIVVEFNTHNNN